VQGKPVSSSKIRALLLEGKVEEARGLLGRYPTVAGEVVRGVGRGRALGFPTANLGVEGKRLIPADGVYAVRAHWSGKNHPAVANIGLRPTFGEGERLVEAHLLDFEGDLYGERVSLEFIKRLRPEVKFASAEELVAQMRHDVAEAREALTSGSSAKSHQDDICRYQEIEHTADRAIRAYGRDLPELFANAAYGMFDLLTDVEGLRSTVEREVSLEAPDLETLLVDWLRELLYLHEVNGEVYKEFEIGTLSPTRLKAVVKGGKVFAPRLDIKAVTYHGLKIEETEEGYRATIVFDV
jgi:SHS2 domain-containing protein